MDAVKRETVLRAAHNYARRAGGSLGARALRPGEHGPGASLPEIAHVPDAFRAG